MPYHHLTPLERKSIDSMLAMNFTQTKMAKVLSRNQSTLSRELKRYRERDGHYNPHTGNVMYHKHRERLPVKGKIDNAKLMAIVSEKLKEKWAPEQVSGWLREEKHPQDKAMWVSHETIYRYVRQDRAKGGQLYKHLRHSRKRFSNRVQARSSMGKIKDRVSIEERPAIVDEQARIGDWEGDTVVGKAQQGAFATLVERKTLFLVAHTMDDRKAASLNEAVLTAMKHIPRQKMQTLTLDNGSEFTHFKVLEEALGMKVYFAHPYRAWERAINENTNGLIRQYLPKKTSFADLTQQQLDEIVDQLNNRPRKKLNYRTPRQAFEEDLYALGT